MPVLPLSGALAGVLVALVTSALPIGIPPCHELQGLHQRRGVMADQSGLVPPGRSTQPKTQSGLGTKLPSSAVPGR